MDKTNKALMYIQSFMRKHWFTLLAVTTYLFFTVYYMGPSTIITDCSNTVNGFGDNTAGPIWKAKSAGGSPIGGFETMTNYPAGESLSSPVDAVVAGQSILMWTTAKIAGPVCGYNLTNALGFLSSSLVMCGFVYSLTRRRHWIALLAGYAVAFTPYFQVKVGGHPSYGFEGLLIGIMWAFLSLMRTQKKSRAVILGLLVAVCFYFDPYFSLLAATILGGLGLTWLAVMIIQSRKGLLSKNQLIKEVKLLLLSVAVLVAAVTPLPVIMISQSSQINAFVAGTRDNVVGVAKACSNLPHEYLLPFPQSPLFKLLGGQDQKVHSILYAYSNCGLAEDAVGISLVMIGIIAIFFVVLSWEKLQKRKIGLTKMLNYDPKLVVYGSAVVLVVAMILALPPAHIFGIPLPSYIIATTTSIWRIIAREYVVVNIAVVVLFAVSLAYFASLVRMKRWMKLALFLFIFLAMFVQYQTYKPFQGNEANRFSYSKAPTGYYWLKQQTDTHAVAEYPIEKASEANSHGYYLTMQYIHGKPLLNSALPNSPDDAVRSSIKNLSDPITIPVLASLGIDTIVVHGVDRTDLEKIPFIKIVFAGDHKPDGRLPDSGTITKDSLIIAKITSDVPKVNSSMQFLDNLPRNKEIQPSAIDWGYEIPSGSKVSLRKLNNSRQSDDSGMICFMIKMAASGDTSSLSVKDINGTQLTFNLDDRFQSIALSVRKDDVLRLVSDNGHNMRMTKIGCLN